MVYHLQPIFILMLAYYDIVYVVYDINKCNEMHKMCHTFCASVIFCTYYGIVPFDADGSIFPMRN